MRTMRLYDDRKEFLGFITAPLPESPRLLIYAGKHFIWTGHDRYEQIPPAQVATVKDEEVSLC